MNRAKLRDIFVRLFSQKKLFWIVTAAGLFVDLATKAWAEAVVEPRDYIPIIEGVIAWKWAVNMGAAFSILSGRVVLLALIGAGALCALLYYVHQTDRSERTMLAGLGLIGAGAAGNVYDRIRFGWVRDFMYFDFDLPLHESVGFIPKRYPVFNVADIFILAGVVMLVVMLSIHERRERRARRARA